MSYVSFENERGEGVLVKYHGIVLAVALGCASAGHAATTRGPTEPVPTNDPGTWVLGEDYPREELLNEVSGITTFKLSVDQTGKIVGCEIAASSGSATLDAVTCALVTSRAQFTPAKDARGRAVAGSYSNRIRWTIPNPGPLTMPKSKFQMVATVDVDKEGIVERCDYTVDGEDLAGISIPDTLCSEDLAVGYNLGRVVDDTGNPVAVRVQVIQSVEFSAR